MERPITSVEKARLNAVYELILRGGDLSKSDANNKQDLEKVNLYFDLIKLGDKLYTFI